MNMVFYCTFNFRHGHSFYLPAGTVAVAVVPTLRLSKDGDGADCPDLCADTDADANTDDDDVAEPRLAGS